MPEVERLKRQVAYKLRVSDILSASFLKDEASAGYIKINDVNVSRVNIIGTVVYKSGQDNNASVIIDDGSGKVLLRTFENFYLFSNVDVGDVVIAVGRVREFNNEKYIMPELLKKTGVDWFNVRKLELEKNKTDVAEKEKNLADSADMKAELYLLIKNLDAGDGVSVDDVLSNSKLENAEDMINKLLENGDVFEIRPGRLKVLE